MNYHPHLCAGVRVVEVMSWRHITKPNRLRNRPWLASLCLICSIVVGGVWLVLCSRLLMSINHIHKTDRPKRQLSLFQQLRNENLSNSQPKSLADDLNFRGPSDQNLHQNYRRGMSLEGMWYESLSPVLRSGKEDSSGSNSGDSEGRNSSKFSNIILKKDTNEGILERFKEQSNTSVAMEITLMNDSRKDEMSGSGSTCTTNAIAGQPYRYPRMFNKDFREMVTKLKIFVYPHNRNEPFQNIFMPVDFEPFGNYASESYFKKALMSSNFITNNASEADLFYLPFSIARLRHDPRVGVDGIEVFVRNYIADIRQKWPYWNRTGGVDHFYVSCHSISRTVAEKIEELRLYAIQVVCSANYYLWGYVPHKDISLPQVWPRKGTPPRAETMKQRKTLAFFAGAANSKVREELAKAWSNDSEILVYSKRISTPYSESLLTSKFCLHVKGFEVNTARIADALYYGCVPVILSNNYDLPFNGILDWNQLAVVVSTFDISLLKMTLRELKAADYKKLHKNVMKARRHFEWHAPPREYDAFYMIMYELWSKRHVLRFSL